MRFGVMLPTFDAHRTGIPPVGAAAREAEDVGLDAVWVGDHLACNAPVLDAPVALATAAASTERIALGFSVLLLGMRPTAWAAKQLATIAALAGEHRGALSLGVGVGGEHPEEFLAAGVDPRRRGRLLDEALDVLPAMLRGEPLAAGGARLELAMATAPRILVGGRREAALQRAARVGDVWLPLWIDPGALRERTARLAELAAVHARPTPRTAVLVGIHVDADRAVARREAAAHIEGQYAVDFARVDRWTLAGPADEVAEGLAALEDAGASEVVAFPLARDPIAQYDRLAEVRDRLGHARAPA